MNQMSRWGGFNFTCRVFESLRMVVDVHSDSTSNIELSTAYAAPEIFRDTPKKSNVHQTTTVL